MSPLRPLPRIALRVALAASALLLLAQLVPYGRDHANPPVAAEPHWDSPRTRALFLRACGDCHSHETRWPWYSHVAPVSWLVQHDVEEGREKLNVSDWGRKRQDGDEAYEAFAEGEMPLPAYLLTHPEARLGPADRQALLAGLEATFGRKR